MSEFRRKILGLEKPEEKISFTKVINTINSTEGYKYFLRKFDDSRLIWIMRFPNNGTSGYLEVYDLDGNLIANLNINSTYKSGAVIDNYVIFYNGTSYYDISLSVYELKNNQLIFVKNSPSVRNHLAGYYFCFKNNNEIHLCSNSNSIRLCPFDYNVTTNTVQRVEPSYSLFLQIYHFEEETNYYRGFTFFYNNDNLTPVGYIKDTVVAKAHSAGYPQLNSYYNVQFIPLFNYSNNINDIDKELFVLKYNGGVSSGIYQNISNLNTLETPTSLQLGNISIAIKYAPLSYFYNGVLEMYAYNSNTQLIEKII